MPRTLSATLTTATTNTVTTPFYCLYLGFSPVLRYSTRGIVTISGDVFSSASFEVALDNTASGGVTASVTVASLDGGLRTVVLANAIYRTPAKLYAVYGDSTYTYADDTILLLDGYISAAPRIDDYVTLSLVSTGYERRLPPIVLGPPHCNHIPPPGSTITLVAGSTSTVNNPPSPAPKPKPVQTKIQPSQPPKPKPKPTNQPSYAGRPERPTGPTAPAGANNIRSTGRVQSGTGIPERSTRPTAPAGANNIRSTGATPSASPRNPAAMPAPSRSANNQPPARPETKRTADTGRRESGARTAPRGANNIRSTGSSRNPTTPRR